MKAVDLALDLAARYGTSLESRGSKLHVKVGTTPPPELLEVLRRHKVAILAMLSPSSPVPAGWRKIVDDQGRVRIASGCSLTDAELQADDIERQAIRQEGKP